MAVKFDHTIIHVRDKQVSSAFFTAIFGLPAAEPRTYGPFLGVRLSNEVSLDFIDAEGEVPSRHYAFLVSEPEFDEIFGRIGERKLSYWADPFHEEPGQINTRDGGRGVYFEDPSGHSLEMITRPYSSETPWPGR